MVLTMESPLRCEAAAALVLAALVTFPDDGAVFLRDGGTGVCDFHETVIFFRYQPDEDFLVFR